MQLASFTERTTSPGKLTPLRASYLPASGWGSHAVSPSRRLDVEKTEEVRRGKYGTARRVWSIS